MHWKNAKPLTIAACVLIWSSAQIGCQTTKPTTQKPDEPAARSTSKPKPEPEPEREPEQPKAPKLVLTQAQWQKVKSHLLAKEPNPRYPIGANFDDKIELIGFDVDGPLVAGEQATFTWYWRALDDIDSNWKVLVHFDSSENPFRNNLDHEPIDGLFPTGHWKEGQIIEDVQEVTLLPKSPAGKTVPYIGLFRGDTRLPLRDGVEKTRDNRVIGPTLSVDRPQKSH